MIARSVRIEVTDTHNFWFLVIFIVFEWHGGRRMVSVCTICALLSPPLLFPFTVFNLRLPLPWHGSAVYPLLCVKNKIPVFIQTFPQKFSTATLRQLMKSRAKLWESRFFEVIYTFPEDGTTGYYANIAESRQHFNSVYKTVYVASTNIRLCYTYKYVYVTNTTQVPSWIVCLGKQYCLNQRVACVTMRCRPGDCTMSMPGPWHDRICNLLDSA